jgi:hypothetical protein
VPDDLGDDLVDVETVGLDRHGVFGPPEGGGFSGCVASVAPAQVGENLLEREPAPFGALFVMPALGSFMLACAEKIFKPASGTTTVPMSRPTITTAPVPAMRRWWGKRAARTSGWAATSDTDCSMTGERNSQVTSSPCRKTEYSRPSVSLAGRTSISLSSAKRASAEPSSVHTLERIAARVSAR